MNRKLIAILCVFLMVVSSSLVISAKEIIVYESPVYELANIYDVDNLIMEKYQRYAEYIKANENIHSRTVAEDGDYGLNESDILSLTAEDWIEVERLTELNAESKDIPVNGIENNQYAASLIKSIASSKNESIPSPRVNIGGFEVNNVELSLALAHPIEFTWYSTISVDADDMADSKYTDGSNWYNGNGDAFRHISWSALLYCKFYDENGSSHTEAENHTLLWTNAHEGYNENEAPSAFDESLGLETRMDLYNNLMGMLLAEIRIDMNSYTESIIFERAETWVDDGKGKRIDAVNGVDQLVATTNSEKRPS